jgi:hypothetical protein
MGPAWTRNQEGLCWRGPAVIFWAGLDNTQMQITNMVFFFGTFPMYEGKPISKLQMDIELKQKSVLI